MNAAELFLHEGRAPAIVCANCAEEQRTQRQLQLNVRRFAWQLRHSGIVAGDRVLILAGTSIEAVETILSVFSVGGVAVPLNPGTALEVLEVIICETRPAACVLDFEPDAATRAILRRHCRLFVHLHLSQQSDLSPAVSYRAVLALPETAVIESEDREEHAALIVHTSGSTGRPKAILFTHHHLRVFLQWDHLLFSQLTDEPDSGAPQGPILTVLALTHFGGLAICLYGLMVRRTVHLVPLFVPARFLQRVEQTRCNCLMLVASMYRELLNVRSLHRWDLSSLRYCVSLGEPCSAELAARIEHAFGATVLSAYGLTECIPGLGHVSADLHSGHVKLGSVGKQVFGEIRLVAEDGSERSDFGELWVRNPTVQSCYVDSALNAERFHDGWFKTRDLFFRDTEGHFFHRGRADDLLICNGRNIYPAEMETILMRHPAVEQACVVSVLTRQARTALAAAVTLRSPLPQSELLAFCSRERPAWSVPQLIQALPALPRTSSGKIDRVEAARLLQADYDTRYPQAPPV